MPTYTFIMEFRGGTYISQVSAENIEQGLVNWCNDLKIDEIKFFGKKTKENIRAVLEEEYNTPTPLESVANVWHFSIRIKVGFLFINIVKTDIT